MREFEALEREYSEKNITDCTNFAKKYYDKHLLKYEHQFENEMDNSNSESNADYIALIMHKRYVEMLVNNYLSISKHHPTYFDNLYKKAKKYLKDNLKRKKYDSIQLNRCSFLLAAMMSFKEYIDYWLPENSDDFNKYYQEFLNIILQMCCEACAESIDNATALSEFSAFLKIQIDNNVIIDTELGTDSDIGWIDRKKNKIYLKNTSGDNFYDKFTKYLKNRHKYLELSKQAFVRDILEENGVIRARTSSKSTNIKRYDYERKILKGHDKFRVLVLDCDLLNIK